MKRRNPGSSTTTRQVNIPQQQISPQPPQQQYGYPPRGPTQVYPPGVGPGIAGGGAPGYPVGGYTQQQQQQPQRSNTQQRQPSVQFEQNTGVPPINRYGTIQMKDAITLITLRLAKLEELTGSPVFNSILETGGVSNDSTTDANTEIIDNINERLNNLEVNITVLMQEMNTLKHSIDTIISYTSVDEEQQRLLVPEWNTQVNCVDDSPITDIDNQVVIEDASTDGENEDDN